MRARVLSPEESIGNPERRDFPLLAGRERLVQAEFRGSLGQAFTDMYGDFRGTLGDVLGMDLANNYRRAVFVSTLNAVMRHLGMIEGTVHCRDEGPGKCAGKLIEMIEREYGRPKIALVGFQPSMASLIGERFPLRITDINPENVGRERCGVVIEGSGRTGENLKWCDIALVTGTTLVNGTIRDFLGIGKPMIFYGVTIAGAAKILGLERFCPCSL
ncbi:MAG: Rossmann-like domain-containing protein [bacterium]